MIRQLFPAAAAAATTITTHRQVCIHSALQTKLHGTLLWQHQFLYFLNIKTKDTLSVASHTTGFLSRRCKNTALACFYLGVVRRRSRRTESMHAT